MYLYYLLATHLARFVHGVDSKEYKSICQRLAAYYDVSEANGKIEIERADDIHEVIWDENEDEENGDWGVFTFHSGDEGMDTVTEIIEQDSVGETVSVPDRKSSKVSKKVKKRVRFAASEKSREVLVPEPRCPYEVVFRRGNLGIELEPLARDGKGALVTQVKAGSQAFRAGIKRTDLLSYINSTDVTNMPLLEIGVQLRKSTRPMVLRFEPLVTLYGSARNSL